MTATPDWLADFPFIQSQWAAINRIKAIYPTLQDYDLPADWQAYQLAFQQNHASPDPYKLLREFRQSRLAYLAYLDLSRPVNEHVKTMNLVSALADWLINQAHAMASADMQVKHGTVKDQDGRVIPLMVFALGKLGTYELNYSSDVDLVFLYRSDGISDGAKPLQAANYFVRLGQKIIKYLDHYTTHGHVYRVDMRLRPFGSAAPLVCTTLAFQQYLLYEGREWERFAWMRARLLTADHSAEAEVMAEINPFIYRKHLDYSVFQSLVQIKHEIAGHLNYSQDDLKQGAGGIRAVEFIVQSLQMVFGGRDHKLQGPSVDVQIKALAAANKLDPTAASDLHEAWLWLRKTENICQMVADQDTHEISAPDQVRSVLANSFGCHDWLDFKQQLDQHRERVAKLFLDLFEETEEDTHLTQSQQQLLQVLVEQLPVARMPQERREQVEQLIIAAMPLAKESVLHQLTALIKCILTRPSYLLMLHKESNVLRKVLLLIDQHPFFVEQLQTYPMLLEQLFEQHEAAIGSAAELEPLWQQMAVPADDLEAWMEGIRRFKLAQQFNWLVAYSEQRITRTQLGLQMTTLAAFVLHQVVMYCWQETCTKYPAAQLPIDALMVVAYGSAAVDDMTAGSDLDLVFLVDADLTQVEHQLFTQKWVKRVIHHLTSSLYHGKLYELDMQLRPNGNSGPLVTTRKQFEQYQMEQAWVWEHVAMVKSKLLVGTTEQQQWYAGFRSQVLSQRRDPADVDQAMADMQQKLHQHGTNKAHHDEFQVLAAVLKHSDQHPELLSTAQLSELQEMAANAGLLVIDGEPLPRHKKTRLPEQTGFLSQ